jgi:hypothetical protein
MEWAKLKHAVGVQPDGVGVKGKGFSDSATQFIWKPAGAGLK